MLRISANMIQSRLFIAWVLLIFYVLPVQSHSADTVEINKNLAKATEFRVSRYVDSSNYYLEKVLRHNDIRNYPDQYCKAKLEQIANLITIRKFEEAEQLNLVLISELSSSSDLPSRYLIQTKSVFGRILHAQGKSIEAIVFYDSAIYEYGQLKDRDAYLNQGHLYNAKASIFARQSLYDQSYECLEKALTLYLDNQAGLQQISAVRNNLGNIYTLIGKYNSGLEQYHESVKLKEKLYDNKNHLSLANAYYNIALLYSEILQDHLALEFAKKAIRIREYTLGLEDSRLFDDYALLGRIYTNLDQDSLARSCLHKALELAPTNYKQDPAELGFLYGELAYFHDNQHEYEKALGYTQQAMKNYKKAFGATSDIAADLTLQLGTINLRKGNYTKGKSYIHEAISQYNEIVGYNSTNLVKAYAALARQYYDEGKYDSALSTIQISININTKSDSSTQINNSAISDTNRLLFALLLKGNILRKNYDIKRETAFLDSASMVYTNCDKLLTHIQSTVSYSDGLVLLDTINALYDNAIENAYILYTTNNNPKYKAQAFHFMERSKSALLRQRVSTLKEQKFGNIPHELISRELYIKEDIAYLQGRIHTVGKEEDNSDNSKFNLLSDQLFERRKDLAELTDKYRKEHPAYFRLNHEHSEPSIYELQEILPSNTLVLNYTVTNDFIYLITTSNDTSDFYRIDRDGAFKETLNTYLEMLSTQGFEPAMFTTTSQELFNRLIPEEVVLKEDILIIPDQELGAIPFGTLVEKQNTNTPNDYKSINYLIKKHNIAYLHSARTLIWNAEQDKETEEIQILAMSSSFLTGERSTISSRQRGALVPLLSAAKEVENLSSIYGDNVFVQKNATENQFRNMMKAKDIIHLASHSIVDHEQPMFSRILFEKNPEDTLHDGSLYTHELYNMSIDADLVILSACNTAVGQLAQGEGILNLGRGFFYAGVPSVVMSHWRVDDESTSELMEHFHSYLSQGYTKDQAMRQAKLQYLNSASPNKNHPYFWGAFVVVGDSDPILNKVSPVYYIGIVLAMIILVTLYIRHHRRKNQR